MRYCCVQILLLECANIGMNLLLQHKRSRAVGGAAEDVLEQQQHEDQLMQQNTQGSAEGAQSAMSSDAVAPATQEVAPGSASEATPG
jgi:hypothetical protein